MIIIEEKQKMTKNLAIILCFTLPCLMTTLGATLIFFFNKPSKLLNQITIGLSAGIMLSASIFSLLLPSLENKTTVFGENSYIPASIGFVLGGLFIVILGYFCRILSKNDQNKAKPIKFFAAMTIHNIPEGLAVGFSLGTAVATNNLYLTAFMFALGIALQNFPEGLATAIPLQKFAKNRKKSFLLAFLSGVIEPIFAILGYFLATSITFLLPWLLSFSAGAMIFVVVEELIPELQEDSSQIGSILLLFGFVLMMIMDLAL